MDETKDKPLHVRLFGDTREERAHRINVLIESLLVLLALYSFLTTWDGWALACGVYIVSSIGGRLLVRKAKQLVAEQREKLDEAARLLVHSHAIVSALWAEVRVHRAARGLPVDGPAAGADEQKGTLQ